MRRSPLIFKMIFMVLAARRPPAYMSPMISALYSDRILEAAAAIPPARRLERPDASVRKVSRVCGSEIEVDLILADGRVADFGMEARACAMGQAAASIVARNIIGATPEELYRLREEMRAMLKQNGPPPAGDRWAALEALQAIRDYPQRHASTMLVFEAVAACLDQIEAAKSAAAPPVAGAH